jgi:ubiquitin C-terminal hydrolase
MLYHCRPFRDQILQVKLPAADPPSMLHEVQVLFKDLESQKKSVGAYNHKRFVAAIKRHNELFNNDEHQDAHEFLTWLLDQMHETLAKDGIPSFVQDLFGGSLQSTFTCLCCEQFSKRSEAFNNLSLDIEKNTSLNYCIQRFSVKELLNKSNKLQCETCLTKQVGTKEI